MKILEKNLPLFPLQTVVFPQARLPLSIFESRYVEMIEHCLQQDLAFGTVLIKEGSEVGEPGVPHQVGTIVRIVDVARLDDGRMNLIAAGITRFKISEYFADLPYMTAHVQVWRDEDVDIGKAEVVRRKAAKSFERYVRTLQNIVAVEEQEEVEDKPLDAPKDPTLLSYLIAANLQISNLDKQSLLEAETTVARLRREILFMERERELLRLVSEKTDRVVDQGTFSLN